MQQHARASTNARANTHCGVIDSWDKEMQCMATTIASSSVQAVKFYNVGKLVIRRGEAAASAAAADNAAAAAAAATAAAAAAAAATAAAAAAAENASAAADYADNAAVVLRTAGMESPVQMSIASWLGSLAIECQVTT
jgi:hypothetical protein